MARLVGERFIGVRADQDAEPDLSWRYEDDGWPATIVFAPDGSEIVKRRGYFELAAFASLLQAIIDDPSPGPSVRLQKPWRASDRTHLTAAMRSKLETFFAAQFDQRLAGLGDDSEICRWRSDRIRFDSFTIPRDRAPDARRGTGADRSSLGRYVSRFRYRLEIPHYEKIMRVQTQASITATGDARWRTLYCHAMRYLTSPTSIEVSPFFPGVLLVDAALELNAPAR